MALKKYKPTSPGRRFMTVSTFEEVTKTTPEGTAFRGKRCALSLTGGNRKKIRPGKGRQPDPVLPPGRTTR